MINYFYYFYIKFTL